MIGNPIGYPIGGVETSGTNGVLSVTLDDASILATGALNLFGLASITLDDATLLATATLPIVGTESTLLDDCSLASTSTFSIDNITGIGSSNKFITSAMTNYTSITTARGNARQITA